MISILVSEFDCEAAFASGLFKVLFVKVGMLVLEACGVERFCCTVAGNGGLEHSAIPRLDGV